MDKGKKWNIGWGFTSACNMSCEFCYSKVVRKSGTDIDIDKCLEFIDKNYKKINSINYGTGENSLSDEWFVLIDYIRSKYPQILQAVTTNGYLGTRIKQNREYFKIVMRAIDEMDISLDFSDEEKHNKFRGNENAYEWAMNTLKFCQEANKRPTIVFVGTNSTLAKENLEGLFRIAEKYNAKLRMNIFRPTHGINKHTLKFIASYDNILKSIKWISDNHKVLSLSDPLFCAILTDNEISIDHSGEDSMRILHTGDITPSTYLITDEFKLTGIENENLDNIKLVNKIPVECKGCDFFERCKGGTLDRRYLWYNDISERDPYCPFRTGNYLPNFKVKISFDKTFSSVHDGYLPTLFFGV